MILYWFLGCQHARNSWKNATNTFATNDEPRMVFVVAFFSDRCRKSLTKVSSFFCPWYVGIGNEMFLTQKVWQQCHQMVARQKFREVFRAGYFNCCSGQLWFLRYSVNPRRLGTCGFSPSKLMCHWPISRRKIWKQNPKASFFLAQARRLGTDRSRS